MKKAKVMLLAIAVLATVGTALAFKVKTVGSFSYCWVETDTQPAPGECPHGAFPVRDNPIGNTKIYYTITNDHLKCDQNPLLECPNETPGLRD